MWIPSLVPKFKLVTFQLDRAETQDPIGSFHCLTWNHSVDHVTYYYLNLDCPGLPAAWSESPYLEYSDQQAAC